MDSVTSGSGYQSKSSMYIRVLDSIELAEAVPIIFSCAGGLIFGLKSILISLNFYCYSVVMRHVLYTYTKARHSSSCIQAFMCPSIKK